MEELQSGEARATSKGLHVKNDARAPLELLQRPPVGKEVLERRLLLPHCWRGERLYCQALRFAIAGIRRAPKRSFRVSDETHRILQSVTPATSVAGLFTKKAKEKRGGQGAGQ